MTHTRMFTSMASTTQSQKIVQNIVSGFFSVCGSVAVFVMNVKVIFATAMLTGVVVTHQRSLTIAAKQIIVFGFIGVLLQALFIADKPFSNLAYLIGLLTVWASFLWTRPVLKIFSAICAVQNRPNNNAALFCTKFAQGFNVLLSLVFWRTAFANLLNRSGRLKYSLTHSASFWLVSHCLLLIRNICILTYKVK